MSFHVATEAANAVNRLSFCFLVVTIEGIAVWISRRLKYLVDYRSWRQKFALCGDTKAWAGRKNSFGCFAAASNHRVVEVELRKWSRKIV